MRQSLRTLLLMPLLAAFLSCTPTTPNPPDDGGLTGPDMACRYPCAADDTCPASIYGVCEGVNGSRCCVCRPPDGGLCPVTLQEAAMMCKATGEKHPTCDWIIRQSGG